MRRQAFIVFFIIYSALIGTNSWGGDGDPNICKFHLEKQWGMEMEMFAPFFLETLYFHPDELVGTTVDEDGGVYICDKISETLIKINSGGVEFSVGSVGEGPEDHRAHGEPVLSQDGKVRRSDCSLSPKVIAYGESGQFLKATKLNVDGELNRLFWNGRNLVGIVTRSDFVKGALELSTYIALLSSEGEILREHHMNTTVFSRPGSKPEEELWEMPRVAASADGLVWVQKDHYGDKLLCFDEQFDLAWEVIGDWEPIKRTPEELDAISSQKISGVIFSPVNRTIKRMIARGNGELWVQPWSSRQSGGKVALEAFGLKGEPLGQVEITGLPDRPGEWIIRGPKLLWMADPETSGKGKSYIEVFDLVRQ